MVLMLLKHGTICNHHDVVIRILPGLIKKYYVNKITVA